MYNFIVDFQTETNKDNITGTVPNNPSLTDQPSVHFHSLSSHLKLDKMVPQLVRSPLFATCLVRKHKDYKINVNE